MNQFMFDVETLGVESNAVVLSFACTPFSLDESFNDADAFYEKLLSRTLFVKFDAQEQFKKGRTSDKGTMLFWSEQEPEPRRKSFHKDPDIEVNTATGLARLFDFVKMELGAEANSNVLPQNYTFWQRGGLDQVMLDSLCKNFGIDPFINYWSWMDVRTMLTITKETTVRGYATVPGFNFRNKVVKHDPVHDCSYDILMMLGAV